MALLVFAGQLEAQTRRNVPVSAIDGDTLPSSADVMSGRSVAGPLLESVISRTEYVLGPGDVVNLSIFGFQNQSYTLTISPEGTLVIPTVGVVRVAGKNLHTAERDLARRVRSFYHDVQVELTLAAVRSFKVFLLGDVPNPGVREANAAMRVSEILPAVSADGIARRNVVLKRSNGRTLTVDLARFLYLGELDQNPVLLEGDIVQVPVIDEVVTIQGRVARPGQYELRSGETLSDLIQLANAGGEFRADAADTLRLLRFSDDGRGEVLPISREDALSDRGRQLMLEPFDALFVPALSHYRETRAATILGEVVRPGIYPIEHEVTTVRDLIRMAGGFTPNASLIHATLRRKRNESMIDADARLQSIPPEFMSEDERRILQVMNRADDRNVVIDFREMFASEDSALDVALQDGDRLLIPEFRNEITVLGAVVQPGIVSFEAGRGVDYFVNLAGGYSNRADKNDVMVLKAKLQNRLHRDDVVYLEPGDQIVVPFEEPRTLMDRVRSAENVLSTISGFVLTVVGLNQLWSLISK